VAVSGDGVAVRSREWKLSLEGLNGAELTRFGKILDQRPASLRGETVGEALAEQLLRVRTREGRTAALRVNAVQRAFEQRRG
jgi:hypothetical protein